MQCTSRHYCCGVQLHGAAEQLHGGERCLWECMHTWPYLNALFLHTTPSANSELTSLGSYSSDLQESANLLWVRGPRTACAPLWEPLEDGCCNRSFSGLPLLPAHGRAGEFLDMSA